MSSEKPFWEGKTCEEMANLHVKVTFVAGAVLTGITDCSGHIRRSRNGSVVPISANRGAERFVPYRDIESIELLDDPEYERIDDIHDVCTGDIFVATNGNRFSVVTVDDDDETDCTLAVMVQAEIPDFHDWMFNSNFAYALRRKPKLPNHDGLWLDKDDNTWTMRDGSVQMTCIGADDWCFTRAWFSPDSVQVLNAAPFRLAKAVEA
ncbi:hypothetical protein PMQ82_09905 [Bifidobacterium longum]|jgi:hypothetical protein|nr:hypothetical protein [Bifidobacterium longum]MDB6720970.1 hypothetical protein [Bifidobacterium longum]